MRFDASRIGSTATNEYLSDRSNENRENRYLITTDDVNNQNQRVYLTRYI